jgi:hypothetical protein
MRRILTIVLLAGLASTALAGDTELTGFADASYLYDANASMGEFGLDQVEIDVIHQASDKTMVRADLEWVKDGEDFVAQVEQAFMSYTARCDWTFTFGKFNAPIGFELLDAPDMYQFSHSLVFDFGLPTNLTGAAVSRDIGERFDVIAYGCNGWDANTEMGKNLTFGGRLGYAGPCGLAGGVSAISGKEEMDDGAGGLDPFTRTVFDVDLGYEKGAWTFGGEFNLGKVTLADDSEVDWTGFLVMTHYDVNEWFGLTARYDTFDDSDGYVFGLVGAEPQTRSSFTLAPTFALDDGFGALVELRIDMSDQDAFVDSDGEPTDSATTIAFEMTYSW